MEDDDLAEIRAKRMAELGMSGGGGAGAGGGAQNQQEAMQKQQEAKSMMLAQVNVVVFHWIGCLFGLCFSLLTFCPISYC